MSDLGPPRSGELAALDWLAGRLGTPPGLEIRAGDDTAVVEVDGPFQLFATDLVAEASHFDRSLSSLADVGWKVLAANVSDIAAMGGRPTHAVVGVAGASIQDLEELYRGLIAASERYSCPVVGGDLCDASALVVSVAIIGRCDGHSPVRRSGAEAGDRLFVTGPLGRSAAGLRQLRADPTSSGELVDAHRRPEARLDEGMAAAQAHATAMIDLSDGLALDLHRLADASGVGFELSAAPVAEGATEEEALSGGEDYELLFSAPSLEPVMEAFERSSLRPPKEIGMINDSKDVRLFNGLPLARRGYEHRLS